MPAKPALRLVPEPTASAPESAPTVDPREATWREEAALVEALRRGEPSAPGALYDRHAPYLRRVLARVLGVDDELPEVLHETFAQALSSIDSLDDPRRLRAWLVRVAVFTARGTIRRRRRQRWLRFGAPEDLPPATTVGHGPRTEARATLRQVYAILDEIPVKERVPFTLRYFQGLELTEVADACDVSLSSVKRYLKRAEERFVRLAHAEPSVRERLARSPRFATRLREAGLVPFEDPALSGIRPAVGEPEPDADPSAWAAAETE